MKKIIVLILTLIVLPGLCTSIYAQEVKRPKLVVGIVVDQMRFDYLYKYYPFYGNGGFKRLMEEGSNFTFAHFNYEVTKTAPGHASIYSGTTPFYHGIIGNDWYDKQSKKSVNAVVDPNYKSVSSKHIETGWHLALPIEKYAMSEPDETNNEEDVFSEGKTSFPHTFKNVKAEDKYSKVSTTPFGNELVYEFAKSAIVNENLGSDDYTDFLAVSFSSTDYVGHAYGTNAYETQDIYVRLDSTIADFLTTLDKTLGEGNYLLFLTADHAGIETPSFLRENKIPAGELGNKNFTNLVSEFVPKTFGSDKLIENFSNKQIYFDREEVKKKGVDIHQLQQKTADFIRDSFPMVATIYTRDNLEGKAATREPENPILNSYNMAIAGDIFYTLQSGNLPTFREQGTTHGTEFSYDTHVPLLFFGWNVPKQTVNTPVYIVDIAPTIVDLIKIAEPSASIGIPLIKGN